MKSESNPETGEYCIFYDREDLVRLKAIIDGTMCLADALRQLTVEEEMNFDCAIQWLRHMEKIKADPNYIDSEFPIL